MMIVFLIIQKVFKKYSKSIQKAFRKYKKSIKQHKTYL